MYNLKGRTLTVGLYELSYQHRGGKTNRSTKAKLGRNTGPELSRKRVYRQCIKKIHAIPKKYREYYIIQSKSVEVAPKKSNLRKLFLDVFYN